MAFKMNPALKAYGKSAGSNRVMKMDPSAMKEDKKTGTSLPNVTVTAEKGRNPDGSPDKNSERYKKAVAAAKRKKENEAKQQALDKKVKSGGDLSYKESVQVASQNKNKITNFTGKKIAGKSKGAGAEKVD